MHDDEQLDILVAIAADYARDPLWSIVCPASVAEAMALVAWYHGEGEGSERTLAADDLRAFAMHIATHMAQWRTMWPVPPEHP